MTYKKITVLLTLLVLICIVGFGATIYFKQTTITPSPSIATRESARQTLFVDPDSALQQYELALTQATNQEEINRAKFGIAETIYEKGDKAEGARLFKEIISSSTSPNIERAYAIQLLVDYFSLSGADQEVYNLIFTGEPYASFTRVANGNKRQALILLVKYGLSFYSLPILQLRLAGYEADTYRELTKESPVDVVKLTNSKKAVGDALAAAEIGIAEIKNKDTVFFLPQIYNLKARALADMALAGDSSLGDPAAAYEESLTLEQNYPNPVTKQFTLYNYTLYLFALNDYAAHGAKITELVKQLNKPGTSNLSVINSLKTMLARNNQTEQKRLRDLAAVNEEFKQLLIKAGWNI